MSEIVPQEYSELLGTIKQRIRGAQYEALRAVNKELLTLYWDIGRLIVERQSDGGRSVVEQLARDLRAEFPGTGGFSARNIWYMRTLYLEYRDNEKLQPLVAEIGWSHNLIILEKCGDDLEREFYLRMARRFGWTKSVLLHQIENQTYRKTLLGQTNFDAVLPEEARAQAKLAVKDQYTFDFLELSDEHSERQLEAAILSRVEPFLREMGGMFAFVGSQYRLEVGDQEYFVDLLLYHRRLRCLVALELKVGAFQPEHAGKMQFYLSVLDDRVREEGEDPPIGIILCKTKDRTVVEYALKESGQPIGVATYRLFSALPEGLTGELPRPEQIARLLEGLNE